MASRFLTIDEVVAVAMSIIPEASSEEENIFRHWAWMGLRDLGPTSDHLEVVTLTPTSLSFTKPSDFIYGAELAIFNSNDEEIYYKFRKGKSRVHQDVSRDLANNVEISEDQFYYHMSSNANNVTYAVLRYFKMPTDDNGDPMFPDSTSLCIALFIKYMWAMRMGNRLEQSSAWDQWNVERTKTKGRLRSNGQLNYKQIAKEWVSMIPKPRYNFF